MSERKAERVLQSFLAHARGEEAFVGWHLLAPLGPDLTHFQSDGLHPTAAAQALILEGVVGAWQQARSPIVPVPPLPAPHP